MQKHKLTEEDIAKLGITDAMPGENATMEEMIALGVVQPNTAPDGSQIAPPNAPVSEQSTGTTAPFSMADLLSTLQSAPGSGEEGDPYGKMSKTQRRMLAFAAISDAGRALQGKEGTMVPTLLKDFTMRADQARKAAATERARSMMGMVAQNMQAIADPKKKLELLNNYLMQGVIDPTIYSAMASQLSAQVQEAAAATANAVGASTALNTIQDIQNMVSQNAALTTGAVGWALSKVPFTEAAALTDLIDTLRSKMALGALRELKAGGATLGSVSEKELALLEADIAKLNPARGVEFLMSQLKDVQDRYESIVRDAYNRDDVDKAKLLEIIGGMQPYLTKDTSGNSASIVPTEEELE